LTIDERPPDDRGRSFAVGAALVHDPSKFGSLAWMPRDEGRHLKSERDELLRRIFDRGPAPMAELLRLRHTGKQGTVMTKNSSRGSGWHLVRNVVVFQAKLAMAAMKLSPTVDAATQPARRSDDAAR
jgi:hypothetical protein